MTDRTPSPQADALWQSACAFAARSHAGQVRKDGLTPYFSHPVRVALTLRQIFGCDDPVALTAAILHDTIEDTPADYDDIADRFGSEIADIVATIPMRGRVTSLNVAAAAAIGLHHVVNVRYGDEATGE